MENAGSPCDDSDMGVHPASREKSGVRSLPMFLLPQPEYGKRGHKGRISSVGGSARSKGMNIRSGGLRSATITPGPLAVWSETLGTCFGIGCRADSSAHCGQNEAMTDKDLWFPLAGVDPRVIVAGRTKIERLDTSAPCSVKTVFQTVLAYRNVAPVTLEIDLSSPAYSALHDSPPF